MTEILDPAYTWGYTTVEGRYVDRLATSILKYGNTSLCFDYIFVLTVLVYERHVHTERSIGVVIFRQLYWSV